MITGFILTPANTNEKKVVPELIQNKPGLKLGYQKNWYFMYDPEAVPG
ncbi:MAG: hypothetical protein NUV31_06480 [Dehalococcoidales bacterium]|nr:hypothetical protein [Dehalococcoidales bacterium]